MSKRTDYSDSSLSSAIASVSKSSPNISFRYTSGNPDCVTVVKDGKVIQSPKVNRPKALCFDYLQLKEMFGLDLETEVITENSEDDSDI